MLLIQHLLTSTLSSILLGKQHFLQKLYHSIVYQFPQASLSLSVYLLNMPSTDPATMIHLKCCHCRNVMKCPSPGVRPSQCTKITLIPLQECQHYMDNCSMCIPWDKKNKRPL